MNPVNCCRLHSIFNKQKGNAIECFDRIILLYIYIDKKQNIDELIGIGEKGHLNDFNSLCCHFRNRACQIK